MILKKIITLVQPDDADEEEDHCTCSAELEEEEDEEYDSRMRLMEWWTKHAVVTEEQQLLSWVKSST